MIHVIVLRSPFTLLKPILEFKTVWDEPVYNPIDQPDHISDYNYGTLSGSITGVPKKDLLEAAVVADNVIGVDYGDPNDGNLFYRIRPSSAHGLCYISDSDRLPHVMLGLCLSVYYCPDEQADVFKIVAGGYTCPVVSDTSYRNAMILYENRLRELANHE